MVDILHTIHYSSIEAYLLEQLKNDGNITPPRSFEEIYPELFWGLDDKKMKKEMQSVMDTLKLLNVLTHYLYYKKDFLDVLDDTIDETLKLLKEKTAPKPLGNRQAYNAIVVLIGNIKPDIIKDRLRDLLPKEYNALRFLIQMRNTIAHQVLSNDQDPFEDGAIT